MSASRSLRAVLAAALALAVSTLAACGGGSGTPAGSGLPPQIKVVALSDLTGSASFLGKQGQAGMNLAIRQINEQGFLGTSTITVEEKDVAGKPQTSANETSRAVADRGVAGIIGNLTTPVASPAAPIAQRGGIPFVVGSSSPFGVVLGEYTYLLATPIIDIQNLNAQYLKDNGATRLAVLYNAENPNLKRISEETLPQLGGQFGYQVVATSSVTSSTVDMSGPVSRLLNAQPDAIALELTGAQSATAVQQLSQRGFHGHYIAQAGVSGGALTPAGDAAKGVTWAASFSPFEPSDWTKKFVEAFKAANGGALPYSAAAESYDATWLLARAIKEAGSVDRKAIADGLAKVAAEGFTGALGPITFTDRTARAKGVLVQWDGTQETLAPSPN